MAHFTSLIFIDSKCSRVRGREKEREREKEKRMGKMWNFLFLYYLRLISWHFKHHFFFVMIKCVHYVLLFLVLSLFFCFHTRIIFMIFLAKWFVTLFWCIHVTRVTSMGKVASYSFFLCFFFFVFFISFSLNLFAIWKCDIKCAKNMKRANLLSISLVSNLVSKQKCQNVKRVEDFQWDARWIVKN